MREPELRFFSTCPLLVVVDAERSPRSLLTLDSSPGDADLYRAVLLVVSFALQDERDKLPLLRHRWPVCPDLDPRDRRLLRPDNSVCWYVGDGSLVLWLDVNGSVNALGVLWSAMASSYLGGGPQSLL